MSTNAPNLPVIFLDDGGVLNDNIRRAPQWQQLVGEYFAPLLGGSHRDWGEANRIAVPPLWPEFFESPLWPGETYHDRDDSYLYAWLEGMCHRMGIATPPRPEAIELARAAETFITARVEAAYPGAPEAVQRLAASGFAINTASGGNSRQLTGYVGAMGILGHFGLLFGPDLVECLKLGGPEYYERVFAAAGVAPRDAIVIDDNATCIAWAGSLGATTLHITPGTTGDATFPSLTTAVDALLDRLGR